MAGFYDMPSATKYLAYGIAIGAICGWMIDGMFVQVVAQLAAVPVESLGVLLLIGIAQGLTFHFFLTREGVRKLRAPPTSGWTMGLGLGAMQASYLMLRMADPNWPGFVSGFEADTLALGLYLSLTVPACEAIVGAWQGSAVVDMRPMATTVKAGLVRGLILIVVALGITSQPILLIGLLPALVYGFSKAEKDWLPAALLPSVRQEYDRTVRKNVVRSRQRIERVRGVSVIEEE